MKRIIYPLTLVLAALAYCEPASARRPLFQQTARLVRQAQYMISEVSGGRQPAIYPPIVTPSVVTSAQVVEPMVANHVVTTPMVAAPVVNSPVVASPVVLAPAPVVVTGSSYDREAIRNMHILDRPNRAGHFYGNTVRRLHYTGRLLPSVR